VSAVAVLLLAATLPASGAADGPASAGAGRWEGTAALADREVPVAVDLAPSADGRGWKGSVVLSGLGVKGAPLSAIAVAPPRVSFALGSGQGEQGLSLQVEARLSAPGQMEGTLSHAGRTSALTLRRTGDAQVDLPLASTEVARGVEGEWRGEYELFGYPRKVTLRLRNEGGVATASFVIDGKRHNDLPVDLVRQEGETVLVVSSATGIRFEGRPSASGDEMTGAVLQGPLESPLTLRRAPRGATP
jgi:hypothetical protein